MIIRLLTGTEYNTSIVDDQRRLINNMRNMRRREKADVLKHIVNLIKNSYNVTSVDGEIYQIAYKYLNELLNSSGSSSPTLFAIPVTTATLNAYTNPTMASSSSSNQFFSASQKLSVNPSPRENLTPVSALSSITIDAAGSNSPMIASSSSITTLNLSLPTQPQQTTASIPSGYTSDKTELEEDGETSFQELYACLMQDIPKYAGNMSLLIMYSSIVLNMFIHMATFTPKAGYGKAQAREYNNKTQLQYFRSQGMHTNAKLFCALTKQQGKTGKSRLRFNPVFIKLISPPDFPEKFCQEIKKLDLKTGYPKPGEKVSSYVMTKIAHAGARENNFSTITHALEMAVSNNQGLRENDALIQNLQRVLKPTKHITALEPNVLIGRSLELLQRFKKLSHNIFPQPNLSSKLLRVRFERVNMLREKAMQANLQKITLDSSHHPITCLLIRLYPKCNINNSTYKEGITNILLSMFAALLNFHTKKSGIQIHTERRQSFGPLRPTITDAGNLTIRLSLGTEPEFFDEVILQSLVELDHLLRIFDFENPEKTDPSVKLVLSHKPKAPEKTTSNKKTDTHIRNSVRGDNNTLTSFQQAEAYLHNALQSGSQDYQAQGMRAYLTDYVIARKTLPIPEHVNVYTGPILPIPACTLALLNNTLLYALDFVKQLKILDNHQPLEGLMHCFYHSLLKLYNNCSAAQTLLENIEKIETTEFYRKATLYTENILEYLISLDGLAQIHAIRTNNYNDPIIALRNTELNYCSRVLEIPSEQLELYFTDSGQQAITTTLLTLSTMLHGPAADGKYYDADVHLFGDTYYEVGSFFDDVKKEGGIKEMRVIEKAKIVMADVTQLHQLPLEKCHAMKALVIDITHNPDYSNEQLRMLVRNIQQRENKVWIVFVESSLKHQQLGLDKYQTGRIMTLSPSPEFVLTEEARDIFSSISNEAMHPCIASFLQMVNKIGHQKLGDNNTQINQLAIDSLPSYSLFSQNSESAASSSSNASLRPTVLPQKSER